MKNFLFIALLIFALRDGAALDGSNRSFSAPEEAVKELQNALSSKSFAELRAIFGPGLDSVMNPDLVAATNEFETVATEIQHSVSFLPSGENRLTIQYGRDSSLFPIPLVQNSGRWQFDTAAGAEEVVNRRIGRNELAVLDVLRTYIQAQREYASADRDGDEVLEYSQRFRSTPGKKDGLYWAPQLDGTISPLGPFVAEAESVGYKSKGAERQPFQGYYYRILTRQGKHAPGGKYNYIINGNMIAGFAIIAWPAAYDDTGVMTFIVNQQGRVLQKDLGRNTHKIAESLSTYNPDRSWTPSAD